jgi:hypothetical protein
MERWEVLVQKFSEYNTDPSEDCGQALEQALAEHERNK